MKEVFGKYAEFYDSLYREKDYGREVRFLLSLASRYGGKRPRRVLDMGCGTGGHMLYLAKRGISVTGFDRSVRMVQIARGKLTRASLQPRAHVVTGDAMTYSDGTRYDMVISMFAVMGYLLDSESFVTALRTAKTHLRPNGLFTFDVWYGPAVLQNLPETRVQQYRRGGGERLVRLVSPELYVNSNVVSVNYTLLRIKKGGRVEEVAETHQMRYFFAPELQYFARVAGFKWKGLFPFLDDSRHPTANDWNVSVVLQNEY